MNSEKSQEQRQKSANEILGNAYMQAGKPFKAEKYFKSNNIEIPVDTFEQAGRKILQNAVDDIGDTSRLYQFESLKKSYDCYKKADKCNLFFTEAVQYFPIDVYNIFGKGYIKKSHLTIFNINFQSVLEIETGEKNEEYINAAWDLVSKMKLKNLSEYIADAYLRIGYVDKGMSIYNKINIPASKKVLLDVAKEYKEDSGDTYTKCLFHLGDHAGLKKYLNLHISGDDIEDDEAMKIALMLVDLRK